MSNVDEVTEPMDTLEGLLEWTEDTVGTCLVGDKLNEVMQTFQEKRRPRTLVCHDMAGGYLEDRFAHGCVADTVYYLREWAYMDVFVYFSHHLVTIPPIGWINAAHAHNVPVLGTFITEWENGERICDQLLADSSKLVTAVDQLTRIAAKYNFDGWLVNIENPVEHVENLVSFVGLLTTKCKENIGPNSLVIWYDSVTAGGQLQWQDQLNEHNKCYFDVCDGIFLNYCWNDTKLDTSLAHAGERLLDVYVGIDVFGRGCFGGGGFNCIQALDCIRQRGLSCAIFAPGWVYQSLDKMLFESNQRKFWSLMTPGLHCNSIIRLPFTTNFVPGKRWYPPKVDPAGSLVDRCFISLRDQDIQPHWFCSRGNDECFLWHDYSYEYPGGAVLKVMWTGRDCRLRLFCCNLACNRPFRIALMYQAKKTECGIALALTFCSRETSTAYVIPDTVDNAKIAALFPSGTHQITYCQAVTSSIVSDVDTLAANLVASEEQMLTQIDLLVFTRNGLPIDCALLSFSICYE